jgi:demethylmenaquinone methyltransferase/2-methoxy-6-polyprenyl-1,4-benzoquinol methylase
MRRLKNRKNFHPDDGWNPGPEKLPSALMLASGSSYNAYLLIWVAKMSEKDTTHFGYREVKTEEKAGMVGDVFDSVASRYDIMNDLMSMGIHRIWKRFTIELSGVRTGNSVLDIAGGTGDLAAKFAPMVGDEGEVVLADINASMLRVGRDRLLDKGVRGNLHYVQADAQYLPFPDDHFDCITIAFGLRNVTDKDLALRSMLRVLKPGGRLLVLEFSKPRNPLLSRAYDAYSFAVLPFMGRLVAGDSDSYQYLAESIRVHPDQETLRQMMEDAGFIRCDYHDMTGGVVAVHRGVKA